MRMNVDAVSQVQKEKLCCNDPHTRETQLYSFDRTALVLVSQSIPFGRAQLGTSIANYCLYADRCGSRRCVLRCHKFKLLPQHLWGRSCRQFSRYFQLFQELKIDVNMYFYVCKSFFSVAFHSVTSQQYNFCTHRTLDWWEAGNSETAFFAYFSALSDAVVYIWMIFQFVFWPVVTGVVITHYGCIRAFYTRARSVAWFFFLGLAPVAGVYFYPSFEMRAETGPMLVRALLSDVRTRVDTGSSSDNQPHKRTTQLPLVAFADQNYCRRWHDNNEVRPLCVLFCTRESKMFMLKHVPTT